MKSYFLIIIISLFSTMSALSQSKASNSEELIRKGARLHDKGNYEQAIQYYKDALKLNSSSMSAVYEMSLSYLKLKDYNKAYEYSSKVIDANFKPLVIDAYAVKGTALADMGKPDDAIKLFKDALNKCGEEYILHFNLGLCYFNTQNRALAIEHLKRAIEIDATHSSAFLLYAYALSDAGEWIQSFYAFHFFLLLEPNTERSADAFNEMYELLQKKYTLGSPELVNADGVDRQEIYEAISAKRPRDNSKESQYKFFVESSRIIFNTLSQLQDDAHSSLMWYFFVPTYQEIMNSGYFETYCRYVSVSCFNESLEWWNDNKEEVDKFIAWFEHGETEGEEEYYEDGVLE